MIYHLCIIRYFLASVSPNNNFDFKIADLLARFPSIDLTAMGFCQDWKEQPLWK